jgi:hypothetical protein
MRMSMELPPIQSSLETTDEPPLLNTYGAARFLGLAPITLKNWRRRAQRIGPNFIRVGRRVRYSWKDLREYLKRRTVRSRDIRRVLK